MAMLGRQVALITADATCTSSMDDVKAASVLIEREITYSDSENDQDDSKDELTPHDFSPPTTPSSSLSLAPQSVLLEFGRSFVSLCVDTNTVRYVRKTWEDFKKSHTSAPEGQWLPLDDKATDLELLCRFTEYMTNLADRSDYCGQRHDILRVLAALINEIDLRCNSGEIHSAVFGNSSITEPISITCVAAYIHASHLLRRVSSPHKSALYRSAIDGTAYVYATFGGQGTANPLEQLQQLNIMYRPYLADFLAKASRHISDLAYSDPYFPRYQQGLDIQLWMDTPEKLPDSEYLMSAPVSFPLIGLLQLMNYKVVAQLLGCSPGEMSTLFRGFGGHSQGIVTATAVSLATDWSNFEKLSLEALHILVSIGCRSQEAFHSPHASHHITGDAEAHDEGVPTCMLNIKGFELNAMENLLRDVNCNLSDSEQLDLALINGPKNFVIGGPPASLHSLNRCIRDSKSPSSSQTRIPFRKRRPHISASFLPISAPFHTRHLSVAAEAVIDDLEGIQFESDRLQISVYDTTTGEDLKSCEKQDLVPRLVNMIMAQRLDWMKSTTFPGASHIVDFGPGKATESVGTLTDKLKSGTGVRTIVFGLIRSPTSSEVGSRSDLFTSEALRGGRNWKLEYQPQLRELAGARTTIDTKLSRLLQTPPIMVAGMTPTTSSAEFVSAVINAGYHVELAGGGFHTPQAMEHAIRTVLTNTPTGTGITCNVIYANPRALKWQISLIKRLRGLHLPIHGLTIGGGVPSLEVATSYIEELGLCHISFKPGSVQAIKQVLEIAKSNPGFPVILQWTGGRGGGHHSFEDFHSPILQTYGKIRQCPNVILVAGSGFGNTRDSFPYLYGDWSLQYGAAHMPFDGILLGSRAMVARETRTSADVKRLIVNTDGVADAEWDRTYSEPAGGILTVISEMGEPIHKIATRGVKLWAELDKTVFCIEDPAKRLRALRDKRDWIISSLNADYHKVWFGRTASGEVVDLSGMTYREVVSRLLDLTYLSETKRWVDLSYKSLMQELLTHIASRFGRADDQLRFVEACETHESLLDIADLVVTLCPQSAAQLLSFQDQAYFTSICRKPGRKPVPFITDLDEKFELYFKKDSLWQSEDLEAVIDQDVGRICVLHGPVAAKYSTSDDQSIKEILEEIHQGHVILCRHASMMDEATSSAGSLGNSQNTHDGLTTEEIICIGKTVIRPDDAVLADDADLELWYSRLAGSRQSWRHDIFTSHYISRDRQFFENPIRRAFRPRNGISVEVGTGSFPTLSLYEKSPGTNSSRVAEVKLLQDGLIVFTMIVNDTADGAPAALSFDFRSCNSNNQTQLQEVTKDRTGRIKDFYFQVWFGRAEASVRSSATKEDTAHGTIFRVTPETLDRFSSAIGNSNDTYCRRNNKRLAAPLDFTVVAAWKALMKPLFQVDGELHNLVHLSNEFRMEDHARPIRESDELSVSSHITRIELQEAGTMVEIQADVSRDRSVVTRITSQFLYRGTFVPKELTFSHENETENLVKISTPGDAAVLFSKEWFYPESADMKLSGTELLFRIKSSYTWSSTKQQPVLSVTGVVFNRENHGGTRNRVASINWTTSKSGNIVQNYLDRHGKPATSFSSFVTPMDVSLGSAIVSAPTDNVTYAHASGDLNPIHLSTVFADFAQLPGRITHGMNSSARIRDVIEKRLCGSDANLFRSFRTHFTSMVLPEDRLHVSLKHVGMRKGRRLYRFEARNMRTSLIAVEGEAEIDNPTAAILFTGQGSQHKGMGMDLRESSPVARELWDQADAHFLATYGFRISDIVKNNPKKLTIYFGGVDGRLIRSNYMALTYKKPGNPLPGQIFESIDGKTSSFTFQSEDGLLSATQFTQPALTLMELAAYEDMDSKGLLPSRPTFAGHSLGEYTAISSIGKLLSLENLMSVVFYRGLAMQMAVQRDEVGRSPYGMCAINPSRLSTPLSEDQLETLVRYIATETGNLLEIVNYNVEGLQYVCAGDTQALCCLTKTLDLVEKHASTKTIPSGQTQQILDIVKAAIPKSSKSLSEKLTRGVATIPLAGIDVPFHSSFLKHGVPAFREFLYKTIRSENIMPARLIGRYVPNLTARPFAIDREYIEKTFALTGSPVLKEILAKWEVSSNQGLCGSHTVRL